MYSWQSVHLCHNYGQREFNAIWQKWNNKANKKYGIVIDIFDIYLVRDNIKLCVYIWFLILQQSLLQNDHLIFLKEIAIYGKYSHNIQVGLKIYADFVAYQFQVRVYVCCESSLCCTFMIPMMYTGLILGLRQANERRRYYVTTSLIGWAQT